MVEASFLPGRRMPAWHAVDSAAACVQCLRTCYSGREFGENWTPSPAAALLPWWLRVVQEGRWAGMSRRLL